MGLLPSLQIAPMQTVGPQLIMAAMVLDFIWLHFVGTRLPLRAQGLCIESLVSAYSSRHIELAPKQRGRFRRCPDVQIQAQSHSGAAGGAVVHLAAAIVFVQGGVVLSRQLHPSMSKAHEGKPFESAPGKPEAKEGARIT